MKIIKLNRDMVAKVDDHKYDLCSQITWHAKFSPDNNSWYARGFLPDHLNEDMKFPTLVYMHRLVKGVRDRSILVDHWNHDTLDNQENNLRMCNYSQNNKSKKRRTTNTTGYKGVSMRPAQGDYRARIMVDGRLIHLGYFIDIEEAGAAYDKAAIELHGEFALTNATLRSMHQSPNPTPHSLPIPPSMPPAIRSLSMVASDSEPAFAPRHS